MFYAPEFVWSNFISRTLKLGVEFGRSVGDSNEFAEIMAMEPIYIPRFVHQLWTAFKFIPLVFLVYWTLNSQLFWALDGHDDLTSSLTCFIVVGWVFRWFLVWIGETTATWRECIMPICLASLYVCHWAHLPMRLYFLAQKPAFERALTRPEQPRSLMPKEAQIGFLVPRQITKVGNSTRFLLYGNSCLVKDDVEDRQNRIFAGEVIGYVYYPTNGRTPGSIKTTKPHFKAYWRYVEEPPQYVHLLGDWYAVKVGGGIQNSMEMMFLTKLTLNSEDETVYSLFQRGKPLDCD